MSSRPLRTEQVGSPKTKGDRIRNARLAANLSQQQLARAISHITKTKVNKSLVSQWERDAVANPTNENMLAIASVTSHSVEWLVKGRGPKHAAAPSAMSTSASTVESRVLTRALQVVLPTAGITAADGRAAAGIYAVLLEQPDIAEAALARLAETLRQA